MHPPRPARGRFRCRILRVFGWAGIALMLASQAVRLCGADDVGTISAEQRAFFEQKIRPTLVEHCYACHSEQAEKAGQLKGGLRLDTRASVLQGGDSGPAIVPGQPAASPLWKALRYDGVEMPPKGQLPAAVIADFETWIRAGAADPRTAGGVARRAEIDIEAGRRHWAYRLPQRHPTPAVADRSWPHHPFDSFLLARLEARALRPAAEAPRGALARRLSYDLVGLPPDPELTAEFSADEAPDAYERLVDRWLASPRFGERWGRHWLDVARFAESITLRGFVLPEAWRYRDYVIETFNADRPLDQFLKEQIAGDLMPADDLAASRRQRIATSYLALGNTNLEEQDKKQLRMDYVDEQLDVIGKGMLAQTLTCARCHDHKFDPIPTRDYYALAGIFRSTKAMEHSNVSKWLEFPLPLPPEEEETHRKHESRVKTLEARLKSIRDAATLAGSAAKSSGPATAVSVQDLPGVVVDDAHAKKVGEWRHSQFVRPFVGAGYLHDVDTGKGDKTLTFQPELPRPGQYEVRLAYTTGGNRSASVPVTIFGADGERTVQVDQRQPPPIDGLWVSLGTHRFEMNGQGFVLVSNEGTRGHVVVDAVQFLPAGAATPPKTSAPDAASPAVSPARPDAQAEETLKQLEAELKQLAQSGPKRPMYLSIREEDADDIGDTQIHIRGLVGNLGAKAPRGVLQVALYDPPPQMPERESGRRQLADWMASPRNPLPARVLANRVWHWVYGAGLVRTTDNFGTTGESPSHPELLDRMATDLVARNWSLKSLVRQLVTLRAYRLSDEAAPETVAADPENRLLGRAHRRRLDAECLVDTMLWVSGELDLTAGGPTLKPALAADYGYQHDSRRRAVYWPVLRNVLPEVFEVFDFADPSLVTGRRSASTVAPQALFLRNHPFVLEQSRQAARRMLADDSAADDSERLGRVYERALGRGPTSREREATREFLRGSGADRETAWAQVFQVLIASVDFRYQ